MNPTTQGGEGNASAQVLYMALELSNKIWRVAFNDGAKRRQVSVPAADLTALGCPEFERVGRGRYRVKES